MIFEVNTLILNELQSMVDEVKRESEEKYVNKSGFDIIVLPEFQRIFLENKEVLSKYY